MLLVAKGPIGAGDFEARNANGGMPRQSSRLAAKSVRSYAKRKLDVEEELEVPKSKPKRRVIEGQEGNMKRRLSVSVKVKDNKLFSATSDGVEVMDSGKADNNQQSDKYCHFCQHAKVNMLACARLGCTHRYCLYCLKTHLEESLDPKSSCSWKDGVWHCPTCRHGYRQRRADVASKRATAHALVSLSSSKPAQSSVPALTSSDCRTGITFERADEKIWKVDAVRTAMPPSCITVKVQSDTCSDEETSCDSDVQIPAPVSDCPISRLLRAMACDKLQKSQQDSKRLITTDIGAAYQASSPHLSHSVEDSVTGKSFNTLGELRPSNQDSAHQGYEKVVVDNKAALPMGLEALAFTAAQVLNRALNECGGCSLEGSERYVPLETACRSVCGSDPAFQERTPPIESIGYWSEQRDQLSALSTPAFSPEFSAIPNGRLPPEPNLLG